mmetsp:Transcript_34245/g.113320  ORF Transcript_34245/g.113320 Transcript_34245/m.113320 type:complete len:202 (+) Transcript_34245:493-1098(+)
MWSKSASHSGRRAMHQRMSFCSHEKRRSLLTGAPSDALRSGNGTARSILSARKAPAQWRSHQSEPCTQQCRLRSDHGWKRRALLVLESSGPHKPCSQPSTPTMSTAGFSALEYEMPHPTCTWALMPISEARPVAFSAALVASAKGARSTSERVALAPPEANAPSKTSITSPISISDATPRSLLDRLTAGREAGEGAHPHPA